jgi:hypothetical protein
MVAGNKKTPLQLATSLMAPVSIIYVFQFFARETKWRQNAGRTVFKWIFAVIKLAMAFGVFPDSLHSSLHSFSQCYPVAALLFYPLIAVHLVKDDYRLPS